MSKTDDFFAASLKRHDAEVAAGEHDAQCEFEPGFYLCNCSKRRRLAEGFTELPTEDLDFPPPSCPRCDRYLNHNGDGWECRVCPIAWGSAGTASSAHFTDDRGDLSRCDVHDRRACVPCGLKGGAQ